MCVKCKQNKGSKGSKDKWEDGCGCGCGRMDVNQMNE